MLAACLAAVCAYALPAATAFGEGSVDLNAGPDTAKRHSLLMIGAIAPPNEPHRYSVLRVYARAGETIQMASSAMQLAGGQDNILVYPPGTSFASSTDPTARAPLPSDPVFAADVFDCNVDDLGTGRIASRAQELAGPAPNPGGYVPCEFVAPSDGIYPIVMLPPNPTGAPSFGPNTVANPIVSALQLSQIPLWDVTVRDAGGVVQPGRLFSHRLALNEVGGANLSTSDVDSYLYTPAGYQYRVGFFNHHGQAWEMAANDRGVDDATTGERIFASFQWGSSDVASDNTAVHFEAAAPQITAPDLGQDSRFPIFVNPPDPVAITGPGGLAATSGFASSPISPSGALSNLAFTGSGGEQGGTAQGSGGTIRFGSPPQMDGLGYTVEIDLDQNGSFGDPSDLVDDTGDLASSGQNSFAWNGRRVDGTTPACGSYVYRVRSTLAEVHLTQSDVETSGGTRIERLSLPGDPALGDPLAANYNDIDPYKGAAITNTSPSAVTEGTSGPGFHSWTADTGNADFVDTWMRLPEVVSSGSLRVLCPGEVSVDKRASDGRVVVGDTVTYRLVAKNNSAGQADGVVVEDQVPSKLDVRSASSTQGDCDVSGNRVRCEVGALASGAEATVTVRAVAADAGQTTNTGIVVAERCPAAQCDTDPAKVTIVKPKLGLTKRVDDTRVRAGEIVTYVIRVTNPSKRAVRNVRTCDHLPAGLVAVRATPKVRVSNGRYCWTAKRLRAGQTKRYELTTRTLPGASGRTVNKATANSGTASSTARVARAIRVLPRQAAGGGVTG
jgi:uncharacterized repeat protein (TIGR01451 family)